MIKHLTPAAHVRGCCDHHRHDGEHPGHHDHDHAHHDHDYGASCNPDGQGARCCTAAASDAVLSAQDTAVTAVPSGSMRTRLRIAEMDCPTEEALIRKRLGGMPEIQGVEFNLMQRILTVVHTRETLPEIQAAIRDIGMSAEPLPETAGAATPSETEAPQEPWVPLALGGAAAIGAEVVHWVGLPEILSAALALAAIVSCGLGTYRKGWIALTNGNLNINALMSIAVTGALLLRQWPEAAAVMVLFTIAEVIEAKSLDRARNAIRTLMQLTPELATVRQSDGTWRELPAKAVTVGQTVRVKPGERIALDGVVTAGNSTVDQAPITGESLPVEKAVGDQVFAGTINQRGSFEYRVTAEATHSTLARIIHAVEEAQGARAPTQRFVDQFARVYTPAVFAVAVAVAVLPPLFLGGSWYDWIYKALVLLVIACPCALVISTPVTIVSGLAAAARHGILIKGGVYLEEGRKLAWLAFDKTGTITHGKPVLTDSVVFGQANGQDTLHVAASLAARSDHPVSRAVANGNKLSAATLLDVSDLAAIPGKGVKGSVAGVRYQLGNHRLAHEMGLCSPEIEAQLERFESEAKTAILLSDGQRALALFAVTDTVKHTSREAIQALHDLGIKTAMLTGDNARTAKAIASQVGIDEAFGDLLPEDKLKIVEGAAGTHSGKTGMVGDGINDAPALARADIGFAMGAAGTDTAIETADVALMDDDVGKIARFIKLSQQAYDVLIQNITLALGIKAVFLVLTVVGLGTMWMAVFADMGASLIVVANGLRLLRE